MAWGKIENPQINKLNKILLNNKWDKELIREMKRNPETNENENIVNLW